MRTHAALAIVAIACAACRSDPSATTGTSAAPAAPAKPTVDWSWVRISRGIALRTGTAIDSHSFEWIPGYMSVVLFDAASADGGAPRTKLLVEKVAQLDLPPGEYQLCPDRPEKTFCKNVTVGNGVVKITASNGPMGWVTIRCEPETACH